MKVLLINKYYYIKGGSETYFFGLKKMLEDNKNEVMTFSMKDNKNLYSPYEKYFVENIDYDKGNILTKIKNSLKLIYSFESYNKLCKLLKDFKPDIAHINLIYHQLTPSVFFALKKYKVPIVFTVHDYKIICPNYKLYIKNHICEKCNNGKYYNCILNKCHKNSILFSMLMTIEAYVHKFLKSYEIPDKIICPSRYIQEKLIKFNINPDKLVQISNFLSEDYQRLANPKMAIKENSILYFGRLSEEKGINTLIEAKKLIDDNVILKIIGEGPLKENLIEKVRKEKIKNIQFLGFKTGEDLINEIRKCKCSILPSNCNETFGLTIIESFCLETPVIGSNIGAIPELITENITGYLFEANNVQELAIKINKLMGLDKTAYSNMITNCSNRSKDYLADGYYKKLINLYNDVISNSIQYINTMYGK